MTSPTSAKESDAASAGIDRYRRAAGSAGALTAAAVLSAAVGLAPQLIIVAHFGLGTTSDAYFMAAAVMLSLSKLLEVHTLPKLYVAVLARYGGRPDDLGRVVSNFLHLTLAVFAPVTLILVVTVPLLVAVFAPGFGREARVLTAELLRVLAVLPLLSAVAGLYVAVLHLLRRFVLASAAQVVPGTVMVVFTLATIDTLGVRSLVVGSVLGQAVHVVILYVSTRAAGVRHHPVFAPRSGDVRETARLVYPFFIGSAVTQSGQFVENIIASMLSGGSLTALAMAKKFRSYMLRFFLETVPTVMYPSMARTAAAGNGEDLARLLREGARMMHFVVLPGLALMAVLSDGLVRVLFQRGAFDATATGKVATCMAIMALGLLPGSLSVLFSRSLFALRETVWLNRTKVVTELSEAGLGLILAYLFGVFGLALATASHTFLNVVQYYLRLRRLIPLRAVFMDRAFFKTMGLTLLAAGAAVALDRAWGRTAATTAWTETGQVLVVVTVAAAVYLGGAWAARMEQVGIVIAVGRSTVRRLAGWAQKEPSAA